MNDYKKLLESLYQIHGKNEAGFSVVTKWLQRTYPGNYTVVECYVPEKYCWGPKLVFEDAQEEMMFILKYS